MLRKKFLMLAAGAGWIIFVGLWRIHNLLAFYKFNQLNPCTVDFLIEMQGADTLGLFIMPAALLLNYFSQRLYHNRTAEVRFHGRKDIVRIALIKSVLMGVFLSLVQLILVCLRCAILRVPLNNWFSSDSVYYYRTTQTLEINSIALILLAFGFCLCKYMVFFVLQDILMWYGLAVVFGWVIEIGISGVEGAYGKIFFNVLNIRYEYLSKNGMQGLLIILCLMIIFAEILYFRRMLRRKDIY